MQGSSENQLEEEMAPAMIYIVLNPISVHPKLPARFRDNAMDNLNKVFLFQTIDWIGLDRVIMQDCLFDWVKEKRFGSLKADNLTMAAYGFTAATLSLTLFRTMPPIPSRQRKFQAHFHIIAHRPRAQDEQDGGYRQREMVSDFVVAPSTHDAAQ